MRHSPPISTTVTATATAFQQWKPVYCTSYANA
jgi:hypothetical protein